MIIYVIGMLFYLVLTIISIVEGEIDNSAVVGVLFFFVLMYKEKSIKDKAKINSMLSDRIKDLEENLKLKDESVGNMKTITENSIAKVNEQQELIEKQNDLILDMKDMLIDSNVVSKEFFEK